MKQSARNLLDPTDGFLRWTALLRAGGVQTMPTPPMSPNCNAFADRVVFTPPERREDLGEITG